MQIADAPAPFWGHFGTHCGASKTPSSWSEPCKEGAPSSRSQISDSMSTRYSVRKSLLMRGA